jgi:glycosyltransferase involved in cell wall biosynthesis
MRILTLTNLYPNPYDPHRATFNRRQLALLAQRHEVRVIAPILWTDELKARWRGGARLPRIRRIVHDAMTVDHPRYYYPPRILRSWYGNCFRWSVRSTFVRTVAEFAPDVIYAPWIYPDGWAGVHLGHAIGLPVVIKAHGSDIHQLEDYRAREKKTVEALRCADGVIAVSHDLAEQVIRLGVDPENVQVIYNTVDSAQFHAGSPEEARQRLGLTNARPMILFVGNLVPVKGVDLLIDACARLETAGVDFTCNLIGKGPLRESLARRIRKLGLERRLTFRGSVPHEQLGDWYRAASVFALASHSEGVPNVLLEAAACGTPFVATRVGGIPEIAHLTRSRLVTPGDAAALAAALAAVLKEPNVPRHGSQIRAPEEAVVELTHAFEQVRQRRQAGVPAALCATASD